MILTKRHRPIGFPTLMNDLLNPELFDKPVKPEFSPAVNIRENEGGFVLELAAPGYAKSDINLEVKNKTLTISSTKEEIKEEKKEDDNYTRKEFGITSFSRSFNLPEDVDRDGITAKYNEGILVLSIPRKPDEEKKVKQIQIG
ncbi:MAG: Hsp20/alpha crystallin family protein [Salibacteraceae bacterium]